MSVKMFTFIKINDIFEELSEENNRLLNELIFAKKCLKSLITFKAFIDYISDKFKNILNSNDWQKFEEMDKNVEEILRQRTDLIDKNKNKIKRNKKLMLNTTHSGDNINRLEGQQFSSDISNPQNGVQNPNQIKFKDSLKTNFMKVFKKSSETVLNQNDVKSDEESSDGSDYSGINDNYSDESIEHNLTESSSNSVDTPLNDKTVNEAERKQEIRLYKCQREGCDYRCKTKRQMKVHYDKHQDIISNEESITEISKHKDKDSIKIICPKNGCTRTMIYSSLRDHMLVVHKESPFDCTLDSCNQIFDTFTEYKHHLLTHSSFADQLNGNTNNVSEQTSTLASTEPVFKRTTLKQYECKDCGQQFTGYGQYGEHKKMHNPFYTCRYGCDYKTPKKKHMSHHERIVHINDPCICHICQKQYKNPLLLKDHIKRLHTKTGVFQCDFEGCHQKFSSMINMRQHRRRAHLLTKTFKCEDPKCHTMFKNRYDAVNHFKRVHLNEVIVGCSWPGCDYMAKTNESLKSHMNVHDSKPKFVCDWPECGKAVRHKNSFLDHMRSHYNDKRWACEWPGCTFKTVTHQSLTKHRRTHRT